MVSTCRTKSLKLLNLVWWSLPPYHVTEIEKYRNATSKHVKHIRSDTQIVPTFINVQEIKDGIVCTPKKTLENAIMTLHCKVSLWRTSGGRCGEKPSAGGTFGEDEKLLAKNMEAKHAHSTWSNVKQWFTYYTYNILQLPFGCLQYMIYLNLIMWFIFIHWPYEYIDLTSNP